MTALAAHATRILDQRLLVRYSDMAFQNALSLLDYTIEHVTPVGQGRVEVLATMLGMRNVRAKMLSITDLSYSQQLNGCSQELRGALVQIGGLLRVRMAKNPPPAAMRRLKCYLLESVSALSQRLHRASTRSGIDFSEALAAASRVAALMESIPDEMRVPDQPDGPNVIRIRPNLSTSVPRKRAKSRQVAQTHSLSIFRTAAPILDEYGPEQHHLVMNAEAIPLELAIALRARED